MREVVGDWSVEGAQDESPSGTSIVATQVSIMAFLTAFKVYMEPHSSCNLCQYVPFSTNSLQGLLY